MARKTATAAAPKTKSSIPPPNEARARLVGKVEIVDLDTVKPNPWNPNSMTEFEKKSLRHGLEKDGWIVSHALTVWRSDEKGQAKMIIIDGEHRWVEARALHMAKGPMTFLDGLTEAQAKALTVKLDQKRGRFNEEKLEVLLRDIAPTLNLETQSLDLGIEADLLSDYLALETEAPSPIIGELPAGQKAAVKTVPLYFPPEQHEEFNRLLKDLASRFKTANATDTVFEAVKRAHAAATKK